MNFIASAVSYLLCSVSLFIETFKKSRPVTESVKITSVVFGLYCISVVLVIATKFSCIHHQNRSKCGRDRTTHLSTETSSTHVSFSWLHNQASSGELL